MRAAPAPATTNIRFARLRGLAADERGQSLIEFGLLLPIFGFITMALVDFGQGFAAKFALQQAAQRTIELAGIGTVGSNYEFLRPEAANAAKVPQSQVELETWLECTSPGGTPQRQASFDGECQSDQMVSRYVQVRIQSSYRPMFPLGPLGSKLGADANGQVPLAAASAVRVQ